MEPQRIKVWQCVGCGRIDDPKPCIGVCRDQKVEYVLAVDHDRETGALRAVAETIARTTPREGQFEAAWRALQQRAAAALAGDE